MSNDELGDVPLRERVEKGVDASGNGYLAVAGELLAAAAAADDVDEAVAQFGRSRREGDRGVVGQPRRVGTTGRVVRLQFAEPSALREGRAAPLSEVLDGVRALLKGRRSNGADARVVAPNHIFCGEGHYSGGPADVVAPAPEMAQPSQPVGHGVRVEVLDTGLFQEHPWWDGGGITAQSVEGISEVTDDDLDGALDAQAGHGTFVAGIVAQQAPAAEIRTQAVLNSYGEGAEHTIAAAIRESGRAFAADGSARWLVLNLSLGGYTEGNAPPLDILDALDTLPPEVVVVAAAGNDYPNCGRPFFPAALKRVLAVGALDEAGTPAGFSNRGPWVDACTLGVGVGSSFFSGFDGPLRGVPDADAFAGFARWSGTSFAAPRVAGKVAAVLSGELPDSAEAEVRHLLRRHGHASASVFSPNGGAVTLPDLGLVIP